jgi:biopolymer transport protein ExbB/TolQ
LFSDHLITIAGRSITITSHDMLMMFVSVVTGLAFWTALYFSRKRVVVLKRSSATDQLTFELSRIANALERIADRPADEAIVAASQRQQQIQRPLQRESKGLAYSILER